MAEVLDQLLLKLGVDLSAVKDAGQKIKSLLQETEMASKSAKTAAAAALHAQSVAYKEVQVSAQAVVASAKAQLVQEQAKQATLKTQSEELKKQTTEYRANIEASKASVAAEAAKQAIFKTQTVELALQTAEMRKQRLEHAASGGGGHGGGSGGGHSITGGLRNAIGRAIFGQGLAGGVAAGVLAGAGITQLLQTAAHAAERLVEKIREGVIESSRLAQMQSEYNRLTSQAGVNADEFLKKLQRGTEGLVGKFELMKTASSALKSPFNIKPDELEAIISATIKLSDVYTNVDRGMQALNQSLLTGRVRGLAMAVGLTQAELKLKGLPPILSETARSSQELHHVWAAIVAKSREMGEIPGTIEDAMRQVRILTGDVLESFGSGLTRSAGTQAFLHMLGASVEGMHEWEKTAEEAGDAVGKSFFAVGAIAETLLPIFTQLGEIGKAVWSGISDAIGTAASKLNVIELDPISEEFSQLHPVLDSTLTFFENINFQIEALLIRFRHVAEWAAENKGIFGAIGGAWAGSRFGPWGTAVGAAAGYALTGENKVAPKLGQYSEPGAVSSYDPTGRRGPASAVSPGVSEGMVPYASYPLGTDAEQGVRIRGPFAPGTRQAKPTVGEELEQAAWIRNAEANERRSRFLDAEKQLREEHEVTPKGEQSEYDERKVRELRLAAEKAYSEAVYKLRQERAKNEAEILKEAYAVEKRIDTARFEDAEESLQTHLDKMKSLTIQERDAQIAEEEQQLTVQRDRFAADRKRTEEEAKDKATPPDILREQLNTITVQEIEAIESSEAKIRAIRAKADADLFAQDRRAAQDRLAAVKAEMTEKYALAERAIRDEATLRSKAIEYEKKDLEKKLQQGNIDPASYTRERVRLAEEAAAVQIQTARNQAEQQFSKARETYKLTPDSQAARQALTNAYKEAAAVATSAIRSLTQTTEQELEDIVDKAYQAQLRLQEVRRRFGNVVRLEESNYREQPTETNAQDLLATLQAQREELRALMEEAPDTQQWEELAVQVQDVTNRINRLNIEMREMKDTARYIGQGFESIGNAVGRIFSSKFAQNLGQMVTGGAASISQSTRLSEVISGKKDYQGRERGVAVTASDHLAKWTDQLTASITAVSNFTNSILGAKSALGGAAGGALGGAGLAKSFSGIPGLSALGGPMGRIGGAVIGGVVGAITGRKNAEVTRKINEFQTNYRNIMRDFAQNSNNIQNTITKLMALVAQVQAVQASSKKGSDKYQQVIDQYNQQIMQLQNQQVQIMRNLDELYVVASAPLAEESFLNDLSQIFKQFDQFVGAADSVEKVAKAYDWLNASMGKYIQKQQQELHQDNLQAIQDALQLNDLLFERQQMMLEYNKQVQAILSQGVLVRTPTRAMTVGSQIQQMQVQYRRQREQLDAQIATQTYRVESERKIFDIALTRIGLENQLVRLQNEQTDLDMARIAALRGVITALQTGDYSLMPSIDDLRNAIPRATSPFAATDTLNSMLSAAYQDRASKGYAEYRGQNIGY